FLNLMLKAFVGMSSTSIMPQVGYAKTSSKKPGIVSTFIAIATQNQYLSLIPLLSSIQALRPRQHPNLNPIHRHVWQLWAYLKSVSAPTRRRPVTVLALATKTNNLLCKALLPPKQMASHG